VCGAVRFESTGRLDRCRPPSSGVDTHASLRPRLTYRIRNYPSTQHCKPIPIIRYPPMQGLHDVGPSTRWSVQRRWPTPRRIDASYAHRSQLQPSEYLEGYKIGSALILHTPKPCAPRLGPIRPPLRGVPITRPSAATLIWPARIGHRFVTLSGWANQIERPHFRVYTPLKPWCLSPTERQRHGRVIEITSTVFTVVFRA
jgi:hypothetical protein